MKGTSVEILFSTVEGHDGNTYEVAHALPDVPWPDEPCKTCGVPSVCATREAFWCVEHAPHTG